MIEMVEMVEMIWLLTFTVQLSKRGTFSALLDVTSSEMLTAFK